MTCVLGMVVRREREIRDFVKTPFYRVLSTIDAQGHTFEGEWRAVKGSRYFESYDLYKENGFKKKEDAQKLMDSLLQPEPVASVIEKVEKKKEKKEREAKRLKEQQEKEQLAIYHHLLQNSVQLCSHLTETDLHFLFSHRNLSSFPPSPI